VGVGSKRYHAVGRDTAEMTGKPAKIKGESVIKRQFAMRKSMYAAFFVFKKRKEVILCF